MHFKRAFFNRLQQHAGALVLRVIFLMGLQMFHRFGLLAFHQIRHAQRQMGVAIAAFNRLLQQRHGAVYAVAAHQKRAVFALDAGFFLWACRSRA